MPREHAARYREVAHILAEEQLLMPAAVAGIDAVLPFRRPTRRDDEVPIERRIRRAAERIGPSAIKIAQMLSTRADLLPARFVEELRGLQDDVAPVDYRIIEETIERELGGTPQTVFETFEREPLAAASIGQVHAATLPGGHPVVVKVQRPDIRKQVEVDIQIALRMVRWLDERGQIPGAIDATAMAEQFADALREEFDYIKEGRNAMRLYEAFRDNDAIVFPPVHWEYTTCYVITMDRIEGVPLNRLDLVDEAGYDRTFLAAAGVDAYLHQIFELGFYHADPHPGNLFALPGRRIGFTDFGRTSALSGASRDAVVDLLLGFVYRDADLATEALIEVSREPGRVRIGPLRSDLDVLLGKYHRRELGQLNIKEIVSELMGLVRTHELGMPADFGLLLSTMGVLDGVGTALDPRFDFVEHARPFAEQLSRRQWSANTIWKQLSRFGRRFARTASDLPLSLDRALRRASEGEFRVAVRVAEYEKVVQRVEELVDRLAFALLIAAFVIGFTLLLSNEELAGWIHFMAGVGMIGASVISVWMFASILLARRKGEDS